MQNWLYKCFVTIICVFSLSVHPLLLLKKGFHMGPLNAGINSDSKILPALLNVSSVFLFSFSIKKEWHLFSAILWKKLLMCPSRLPPPTTIFSGATLTWWRCSCSVISSGWCCASSSSLGQRGSASSVWATWWPVSTSCCLEVAC